MERKIPFYSLDYIHKELEQKLTKSFQSVLHSNWFILGRELEKFETAFSRYIGTRYSIGVGNGYDALKIGLKSLDLAPGSEVIVPAHTFSATILAIIHADLHPVLVDVDPENYLIDVNKIPGKLRPDTKVLLPVHLYGTPCQMGDLQDIATENQLILMEDFAQSVGAEYESGKTGSFGKINAGSFYPVKTLGALGDGGIITTDDEALAEKCRILRNYGYRDKYHQVLQGFNSRLDEIQAVFLQEKLKKLDSQIQEREKIARQYFEYLSGNEKIWFRRQSADNYSRQAYHIFPVRTQNRDQLMMYLKKSGIETQVHYPIPPHLQKSFQSFDYSPGDFPVTEEICKTELSLPIYPGLSEEEVKYICNRINHFFQEA